MENINLDKEQREYFENLSLKDFDGQQKVKDYVQSEINKIIFYLSTGTFVISISFIGYLKNEPMLPWFLISTWFCFLIVIGTQILIHIFSKRIAEKKQILINECRENAFSYSWQNSIKMDPYINNLSKWASRLDIFGFILLVTGLIFLLVFASFNLLCLK